MSTVRFVRAFVSQRLTAAVDEIIAMFEKTITEYETEICRQRRLLGDESSGVSSTTGVSLDVQALIVNTKTVHEQSELRSSLDPAAPEALNIKEEPVWTRPGLQEADHVPELPSVSVKSEDGEDNPPSSPLHHRQTSPPAHPDCGGSEPVFDLDVAGFLKATSDGQLFLSQCFKTEPEDLDQDQDQDQNQNQNQNQNQTTESETCRGALKDDKGASLQKKLFKCPACGKTFKHNGALQRHVTCHTGERPFSCSVCGKTFRQKGSLHIHMRRHTGEKPFSCLVCGKNFTQSGTLAAHMRIHTGEKPFSCSVCKKRYNERGTLVRHMRVHTGEKPFTCSLCGKRFSEKGNLTKHKRIHTGEKPFSCSVCEKTFSLLSHLKNHKCRGKTTADAAERRLRCPRVGVQLTRHRSTSSAEDATG